MGLFSDVESGVRDVFSGERGRQAAAQSAEVLAQATREGIAELRTGREQAFEALDPFRRAGAEQLGGIASLIGDPETQRRFIEDNPFFESLVGRSKSELLSNQAAKGKIGSGGTPAALQERLLGLGTGLIQQNIQQRMGLANIGLGAAGGGATAAQTASRGIADLLGQGASAQAAGIVGAENARQQRQNQLIQLGALAASDRRVKKDIKVIGSYKDLPVYKFKYIWDEKDQIGFMAQDVEHIPEAVVEINGIKHVDYGVVYGH